MKMPDTPRPAEAAELDLPIGSRVIVLSDLFLGAAATEASSSASLEVARALDGFEGPGAVIVAGNLFDLLGNQLRDPGEALAAHPELAPAFRRFHAEDHCRHLVVLPGSRDRAILYDPVAQQAVRGL